METSKSGTAIHNTFVFTFLVSIFALAYVVSPYWMINRSSAGMALLVILTTGIGILWSHLAGGRLEIAISRKALWPLGTLATILFCLNARPLFSVIPWRGDEDYHIHIVLKFLNGAAGRTIPSIAAFLMFVYAGWRKSKWTAPLGILALGLAVAGNLFYPIDFHSILRYPFFTRFFQAIAPGIARPIIGIYHEALYRIVPFLSAVFIAWVCHRANPAPDWRIKLLFGVSVSLMPVVWYYSSVLYIEMPAVLLMVVACLGIENLLNDDFQNIKSNAGWYALILTGFVKETAILILFPFVACRLSNRFFRIFKKKDKLGLRFLADELKIAFCVFLPVTVYIAYRMHFRVKRTFSPDFSHLLNVDPYFALARSWFEQFGLFSVLFVAGCVLLIRQKKLEQLFFSLAMIVTVMVFMILDNPEYAGYSRFNLFAVAPILAVSIACFHHLKDQKAMSLLVLTAVMAANIALSPVNIDGVKKPFWGNYLCDTSEHYYPFRKTLTWLRENRGSERILFAGMDYPYSVGLNFYFNQMGWFPECVVRKPDPNESAMNEFGRIIERAVSEDCPVIVCLDPRDNTPLPSSAGVYSRIKTFENSAHRIFVYSR